MSRVVAIGEAARLEGLVLAGVIMLLIFFVKAKLGLYTQSDHEGIELFGLYWHFVDLVWIILFTIVYLL